MVSDTPYALLDPAEVKRRAREKGNKWIDGLAVVGLDILAYAVTVNAWPITYVIGAVAATSALGFIAVHQARLRWARFHTVPIEMLSQEAAGYRRTNEKAYQALCYAANEGGGLEENFHWVRGKKSDDWFHKAAELQTYISDELMPLLQPHEQHQLRFPDVDLDGFDYPEDRLEEISAIVRVLRSLMDKYAVSMRSNR